VHEAHLDEGLLAARRDERVAEPRCLREFSVYAIDATACPVV
jgi:hypothetical protein